MKPAFVVLALLVLASCQTTIRPPVQGDPAEIYFQRAQAASDLNEYEKAESYYQAFLDNEKTQTHEETFSARYEIAVIKKKKGDLVGAKQDFDAILTDLNDLTKGSDVPAWIRILSQRLSQDIQDRLAKINKTKSN